MNELSERLGKSVKFLIENGYAKTNREIAAKLGVTNPTLSMAITGARTPTWSLLLKLCDIYPVSFDWLRFGSGDMIGTKEATRMRRNAELERENAELKARLFSLLENGQKQ